MLIAVKKPWLQDAGGSVPTETPRPDQAHRISLEGAQVAVRHEFYIVHTFADRSQLHEVSVYTTV
jgi:hypothetical protein